MSTATLATASSRELAQREGVLIRQATRRLARRAALLDVAREIFAGIEAARQPTPQRVEYMGEGQGGTICGKQPGTPPGDNVNFQCSKNDFSCGTFTCEQVYGDCGGSKDSYECKDKFDCKGSGGAEHFFDCHDFSCGDSGKEKGSFNCDTKWDFLCGGPSYQCYDDFDCTGGHVFMCIAKNNCVDSFECKSTGDAACDKLHPYQRPDDGGTDSTPGDFLCGVGKGGNFDCAGDFDCTSKDEFDCAGTAKFVCKTDFDCDGGGAKTTFECDTDFDCVKPDTGFECHCKFSGTDKSK